MVYQASDPNKGISAECSKFSVPRDARRGTFVSRQVLRLSAVAMQAFPQLLCQSHPPSASLPRLMGDVHEREMARGCFPREMPFISGTRKEGDAPGVSHTNATAPSASDLKLWLVITLLENSSHTACLCQFISMYAPVPPKAMLVLSFLSRAPFELALAKKSCCK